MNFFFSILLSFCIFQLYACSDDDIEKNKTILYISDGNFEINKTNVTYLNNKNPNSELSSSGKVWYFQNESDFQTIYNFTKVTQHFILVIHNNTLFLEVLNKPLVGFTIEGIIIPNNTDFYNSVMKAVISSGQYSTFMHNETNITDLIQYDIRTEESNYFFHLSYKSTIFVIPFVYLKTVSIVSFVLSCCIIVLWAIKQRQTPSGDIILIQKIIVFLPYLNLILCALMIIQMFLTTGQSSNSFLDSRIYVETALVTIRAIFRTIIWFLLVLIASGWQITSNSLSRDKIKTFIKVYVFIYIIVCVDQIVDAFVGSIFVIFYPSEIKNIIFYLLMAIGIAYEGMKTLKMIRNKLRYAISLSPEFIPSLLLKQSIIIYHIAYSIGYFIVYSILLIIHKAALAKYNIQDFLLLHYHFLDIIFLSSYLFLYRPRKLPPFFNVDFGEDEIIEFGSIYSSKIPNINEVIDSKTNLLLNKNDINQLRKDSENQMPIIIINPVMITHGDQDKKTINIIIDKISIGYLSQ